MRRLLGCCAASLLLYWVAFALVLDRPLSLGFLQSEIEGKLARGAAISGPKLVIIAGSNGPYSHRCETIEPILALPCVNAGVAVGLGLDYLFARWQPLLHQGDIVYLPLEEAQYTRRRAATVLGPDALIMLRHDRTTLRGLGPDRWAGALFAGDLRGLLMSGIETALVRGGFHDPRATATGRTNAWGDHVGHTAALAADNQATLRLLRPAHPTPAALTEGDGAADIRRFLAWSRGHGVLAVGGLPAGFDDAPIGTAAVVAIRTLFQQAGQEFIVTPTSSRFPRSAFFDSAEHLNEETQIAHSIAVATSLRERLIDWRSKTSQMATSR